MVISETTVHPVATLWHACQRGICESIHIRLSALHPQMELLRVGEQIPRLTYKFELKELNAKQPFFH